MRYHKIKKISNQMMSDWSNEGVAGKVHQISFDNTSLGQNWPQKYQEPKRPTETLIKK